MECRRTARKGMSTPASLRGKQMLGSSWRWCNGSFAQYVQQEVASMKTLPGKNSINSLRSPPWCVAGDSFGGAG